MGVVPTISDRSLRSPLKAVVAGHVQRGSVTTATTEASTIVIDPTSTTVGPQRRTSPTSPAAPTSVSDLEGSWEELFWGAF